MVREEEELSDDDCYLVSGWKELVWISESGENDPWEVVFGREEVQSSE